MHHLRGRGDVVREVVLGYPGTFIDRMRKIFRNLSTRPWKLDRHALFLDVPMYQNCTGVVSSSMNCSTYISVSIISSSRNFSKPHIKIYPFVDNVILGNKKNITFNYFHQKRNVRICLHHDIQCKKDIFQIEDSTSCSNSRSSVSSRCVRNRSSIGWIKYLGYEYPTRFIPSVWGSSIQAFRELF